MALAAPEQVLSQERSQRLQSLPCRLSTHPQPAWGSQV